MKAWKTNSYANKIDEVDIIRFTENRVYYLDNKNKETWSPIISRWQAYHKSYELAKSHLLNKLINEMACLSRLLATIQKEIEKLESL